MLRKVAAKALWMAKGAALFWGSVMTLALVLGVASVALGANGGNFILGQNNVATALTRLTGNAQGSAMQVQNTNPGADDTALNLQVQQGEAPMRVNSDKVVTNLNADRLDGQSSFETGTQAWAVINADGSIRRNGAGSLLVRGLGTGQRQVDLGSISTTDCAYVVTTTDGNGGLTGTAEGDEPGEVIVYTYNFQGNLVNLPFHLVAVC